MFTYFENARAYNATQSGRDTTHGKREKMAESKTLKNHRERDKEIDPERHA